MWCQVSGLQFAKLHCCRCSLSKVLISQYVMMQVLDGVSVWFDGFDGDPRLLQLKIWAHNFEAQLSHYTHVTGFQYTIKVGLAFCANLCLWLSEQDLSLLSRQWWSAYTTDCVLRGDYNLDADVVLNLMRLGCMVCAASSPAASVGNFGY